LSFDDLQLRQEQLISVFGLFKRAALLPAEKPVDPQNGSGNNNTASQRNTHAHGKRTQGKNSGGLAHA
jgi:hypothetical protein